MDLQVLKEQSLPYSFSRKDPRETVSFDVRDKSFPCLKTHFKSFDWKTKCIGPLKKC
jgi:hypothetical protein